jgi:NAD(P)-dependent dehydrogenase (short-subunit alcohol dehydrogenase family)
VAGLTVALAVEYGPSNITVNAIAPGIIDTNLVSSVVSNPVLRDRIVAETPVRRIGKPIDVAEAVLFFVKDGTEFITGRLLLVDGGWGASAHLEFLY